MCQIQTRTKNQNPNNPNNNSGVFFLTNPFCFLWKNFFCNSYLPFVLNLTSLIQSHFVLFRKLFDMLSFFVVVKNICCIYLNLLRKLRLQCILLFLTCLACVQYFLFISRFVLLSSFKYKSSSDN